MFKALSRLVTRRPWLVVVSWLLLVVVSGAAVVTGFGGRNLFERLHNGTSTIPGTESAEVYALTQAGEDKGVAITMVVRGLDLKDQAQAAEVAQQMSAERPRLADLAHVDSVADPFDFTPQDPRGQAFTSKEADGFVALVTLDPGLGTEETAGAEKAVGDEIARFSDELGRKVDGATAMPMSTQVIGDAIIDQVKDDMVRGEAIGLPVSLLLMVLVFGGMVAAGLPLLGALTSILVGLFGVWGLTHAMDLDSFILNVISLIGLALSIDYGLLVVSRFREEIHGGLEAAGFPGDGTRLPELAERRTIAREAVGRTVMTAGRTVTFSALTIAVAIAGLLVMRSPILRSIGLCAVIVVVLAVLTAATLVPALLTLWGHQLMAPSPLARIPGVRWLFRALSDVATDEGAFSRLARWVHRHPWAVMLAVLAVLVTMCLPFGTLQLRNNFAEYIPKGSDAAVAYHEVQDKYPALATADITLVVDVPPAQAAADVAHLSGQEHVTYVSQPQPVPGDEGRTKLGLRMDVDDPVGPEVITLVKELRGWDPGHQVLVGGPAAGQYDFNQSLVERAPLALGIMAAAVLVLMFLMTGSVVVPFKALIINVLSLVSSLGATWFLFEHGLFGLPQIHGMETFVAAVAIAFGFGLAMDYEVFLLARIKEYWDHGHDNDAAVEHGLQRSGRIITSAAAIIVAVFLGFVAGHMLAIKEIGVALALVVVVDATLVRMLLVPATMTVLGRWNWWAPRWLAKVHQKVGITH